MDNALKRQQEAELEAKSVARAGSISRRVGQQASPHRGELYHVKTLHLLDTLLESADPNALIALAAYSTSCGIYKRFLESTESVRDEHQGAVVFVRHDVVTEYDGSSDISQMYRIKAVPVVLLLNRDGAVVGTTRPIASIRQRYRHRDRIEDELRDMRHSLISLLSNHSTSYD